MTGTSTPQIPEIRIIEGTEWRFLAELTSNCSELILTYFRSEPTLLQCIDTPTGGYHIYVHPDHYEGARSAFNTQIEREVSKLRENNHLN